MYMYILAIHPAVLDGASKEIVRQRFREWAAAAAAAAAGSADDGHPEKKNSSSFVPRFKYCIHVEAESLKPVEENTPQRPAPDLNPVGYVNLIVADWTLDEDEDADEIEGFTQRDNVGWMKVAVMVWRRGLIVCWGRVVGGRFVSCRHQTLL